MKTLRQNKAKKEEPDALVTTTTAFYDHNVCGIKIVLMTGFGTFEATGSAMRNPIDEENPEIAQVLATQRALESLARGLKRRGEGLMKHQEDLVKNRKLMLDAINAALAIAAERDDLPEVQQKVGRRKIIR